MILTESVKQSEQAVEMISTKNIRGISSPITVPYQIVDVAALRMVRTEMGKRIRKQYERHEIHHKYSEHKKAEARRDGCSNSITTVQKDNLVMEIVRCGNVD